MTFFQCLLSCENDWSVAVILPKEGTNGIGLLDKSMQTGCILSLDRIGEGLQEVPHSFAADCEEVLQWVLFAVDKKVLWLVTLPVKAPQRKMQNTCLALRSVWQLFLLSFFPSLKSSLFWKKNTFFFLLYIKLSRFPCIWPFREIIVFFLKASIVKLQSWCNSALYSLSGLSR